MNNKKKTIKYIAFLITLIIIISFIIIINKTNDKDVVDIINIGNYGYIPEKEKYIELVTEKWKELGHDSELIFEDWDCYDGLPNDDFEIYVYDGVVYESLRDKDLLEKIDNIDISYTFDWATKLLEENNDVYGVPFLLCSDFLIYNKDNVDLSNINSLKDVNTTFTTQYRSMVLNYYLTSILSLEKENIVIDIEQGEYQSNIIDKLYMLVNKLNIEDYKKSNSYNYTGKEQMNKGKYNALYGFSESIYDLKDIINEIDIKNISLMDDSNNKVFYVDLISMKKGITEKEEKLYTELIEVMTSEEVNYEYTYNNSDYLYLITANKKALKRLSNDNIIYNKLYSFAANDTNRVFLYGPNYYNEFSSIKDDLKLIIDNYLELKYSN